jgi:multidrug efflux pump subunit AcrA (membrane-fusion protein)
MALSRTLRRHRGWIAFAALCAVAAVTFGVWRSAQADETPVTTYTTEAAETGTLQVTVSGTGNLAYASTTEVWPETAGTVASVEVAEGDKIKAGDVLFSLDESDAKAATAKSLASYEQAESQVAQATAQLTKASSSLDSLEQRAEEPSSTVTDADLKAAEADVDSAEASLASAEAQRASALLDYQEAAAAEDDLTVTAPVSGIVYSLDIEEGDQVSASAGASGGDTGVSDTTASSSGGSSAPLVIRSTKPLVAMLSINEVDLPSLKAGQRADLEFDALPELALTGKVVDIADEGTVDQGVVSFDVEVALDVANKQLRPGMSVSAIIVTAVERDALLVPNAAVKSDDAGSYVQVLDPASGRPQRVDIEVGLSGDTQTQVLAGLEAGAEVITASNDSSDSADDAPPGGGMMMMGGPGR